MIDGDDNIEGLDELDSYLDGVKDRVGDYVASSLFSISELMKTTAVMLCPVALEDGGRLRQSIETFVDIGHESSEGGIGTSVHYAAYNEFGTGLRGSQDSGGYPEPDGLTYNLSWPGMAAQPFLRPALYDNEQDIIQSIVDGVVHGVQP